MDEAGMDDLQDGVSKLADFSTVLSSVTRTLDKNVRRLESEFGKCNSAFKEIKVLVEAQKAITDRLQSESDEQQAALSSAVAANTEVGQPLQPSKFLFNELDAIIRMGLERSHSQQQQQQDSWSKLKEQSDTPARVAVDQAVNDAVHLLNKTLLNEHTKMMEKGTENSKRISKSSSTAKAIGALVRRMYDAENAIALQTTINESLVKALRDDTYLKNSHNALNETCEGLVKSVKELREDHNKLAKVVGEVQQSVATLTVAFDQHREASKEIVRGGRLRVEKRKKRLGGGRGGGGGGDNDYSDESGETVEWGLDGFTLEESDRMLQKVLELEKRVFGPTGLEPKVATLDQHLGETNADVANLKEGQAEVKAWIEANSNELQNKLAVLRVRWDSVLGDINFGLNQFSNERGGMGEDSEFIVKLGDLYDSIESTMDRFSGNNQTKEETLDKLCPMLDNITQQVEDLMRLDQSATKVKAKGTAPANSNEAINFSDIRSLNKLNQTLKDALQLAFDESIYIIDQRIPKLHMKRRIDLLEKTGAKRDDVEKIKVALKKGLEKQKADHKEVTKELKLKASLEDVKKMRAGGGGGGGLPSPTARSSAPSPTPSSIQEEPSIDSMEDSTIGFGGGNDEYFSGGRVGGDGGGGRGGGGGGGAQLDAASSAVLSEMGLRLDLLVKQFKDLQDGIAAFVPREEVHEAMQAVLHEIKLVKLNSVNVNRFKQGLDSKADAQEVQKLVVTLNSAVGDMLGTNVTAAGKAKCLLCDKPVGSVVKDVEKRDRRGRERDRSLSRERSLSPSTAALGVSPEPSVNTLPPREGSAASAASSARIANKITSSASLQNPLPTSKILHEKQAKITSEITVLRNSIDLPLVGGGIGMDGFGTTNSISTPTKYRQRIRDSGAGGFGANYTENSR